MKSQKSLTEKNSRVQFKDSETIIVDGKVLKKINSKKELSEAHKKFVKKAKSAKKKTIIETKVLMDYRPFIEGYDEYTSGSFKQAKTDIKYDKTKKR